jgi:hypothetical protein
MTINGSRRSALFGFGSLIVGASALTAGRSRAAASDQIVGPHAKKLPVLMEQLRRLPRRRGFETVPMVLQHPDLWDNEALKQIIAYGGDRKQVWDNTDIAGPWLNLMRNSLNTQIFSFGHEDFLAVSATHGTAHLALFDESVWDRYELGVLTGTRFTANTLIVPKAPPAGFTENENPESMFGRPGNTIPALRERGVVFLACHNAIWEVAAKLIESGQNPDHKSHEAIAAELTNHLVDGVVLTPGIAATIAELQQAGFHYAA